MVRGGMISVSFGQIFIYGSNRFNKKTLLHEGRGTGWSIPFNCIVPIKKTNNILGHCDGCEMTGHSSGGLRTNDSNSADAWGRYLNQCLIVACINDREKQNRDLSFCNAHHALDRLNSASDVRLVSPWLEH